MRTIFKFFYIFFLLLSCNNDDLNNTKDIIAELPQKV